MGRITEVGEISSGAAMTDAISRNPASLQTWLTNAASTKAQITKTVYDQPYAPLSPVMMAANLRNRVAWTAFYNNAADMASGAHASASFYSYDIHGNVDTLLQDYKQGTMATLNNRFKKLVYRYDLISGKVKHVAYQPGQADAFYHRYSYDAENRLTNVETSRDSVYWENDAFYQYYKHGPLARMVLGHQQVQGVDYAYTLQGWLKGVNGTVMTPQRDMGGDGQSGSVVARDAFGFALHYYGDQRDYTPVGAAAKAFISVSEPGLTGFHPLFNGNIAGMSVALPQLGAPLLNTYTYDVLNRLRTREVSGSVNAATHSWSAYGGLQDYKESLDYDANGNITRNLRQGNPQQGGPIQMDSLTYYYKPGTNQLDYVRDAVAAANYTVDIDNQAAGNYAYDAIGNLVGDAAEGISSIEWTVYGKIARITKGDGTVIRYAYDAAGNRILKEVNGQQTWYVRDAQGNTLSVYRYGDNNLNGGALTQAETHLYGSSRLGITTPGVNVQTIAAPTLTPLPGLGAGINRSFTRGKKYFELSNHLGNVLATVSDKRFGVDSDGDGVIDHYTPDVESAQDYYSFGMMMPGRQFSAGNGYRYGFNGKEKDNEVSGDGNQYDYGFRIYNPAIGRFLSVDPLTKNYPWYTPYQFAGNKPIWAVDLDGLEETGFTMLMDKKYSTVQSAKEQNEINKNTYKTLSTAMFKSVFTENLPKKFLDHYAWGNGQEYRLNKNEVVSLNVFKTGIQGLVMADVEKFKELTKNVGTRDNGKSRNIYIESYSIQAGSNVGGTLGRFTIQIEGKLTFDKNDKTKWTFEGRIRYFDIYDFKTDPVSSNDIQRADWGDFQTRVGNSVLLGTGFPVTSDWINVKQTSSDPYFDYFKDKSTESKQNRASNEIQTSTENGSDMEVPKTIKEVSGGS